MGNPDIKCNVLTCKHNDKKNLCMLDSILVGSQHGSARDKCDTECVSFMAE